MCERRAVLLVLLAGGLALPARAQSRDEAAQRLARLEAIRAAVAASTARADSVRRATVPADTVRVGALTILAPQPLAAAARASGALAWQWLHTVFGQSAAALAPYQFVFQGPGGPDLAPAGPAEWIRTVSVAPWMSDTAAASALAIPASLVIGATRDTTFAHWLRRAPDPRPGALDDLLTETYLELTVQPWEVVRGCEAGDLIACRRALGLVPGGDVLDQWYAAGDRRAFVLQQEGGWIRVGGVEYRACVDGRDTAACTAVMRRIPEPYLPPPLPPAARSALVHLALQLGGAGAYDRLTGTRGTMEARLTTAAGVPSDSLLRAWRAAVDAHRPLPVTLRAPLAWAAFCWAGLLAFLGLRSTRWR